MKTVLWIDDQPERYDIIKDIAIANNITVIFAYGFDQIKYCLENINYSFIIMDHDMPGFDGTQVIFRFFRLSQSIKSINDPIILLCSCNDPARERMKDQLEQLEFRVISSPCHLIDEFRDAFTFCLSNV